MYSNEHVTMLTKLLDTLFNFHDLELQVTKIIMTQSFYDKLNEYHKEGVKEADDIKSVFGIPIEIDDTKTNEFTVTINFNS